MSVLKEWVLHEPAANQAAEEAPDHTLFLGDLSALGVCTQQAQSTPSPGIPPSQILQLLLCRIHPVFGQQKLFVFALGHL